MRNYIAQKQKIAGEEVRRERFIAVRMYVVLFLCFSGFSTVLLRGVYLHLTKNPELKWIADKQYNARVPVSLRRGKLFDRNGEELAVSLPVPSLYADPAQIEDMEGTALKLGTVLEIRSDEILKKLKLARRFVWLKRRMSYDKLKQVVALGLPGISYIEESKRFYPNGELGSQLLGAVGYDSQALAGIEMAHSDTLISKNTTSSYKRDARGRLYAMPVGYEDQTDVGHIYLSIDKQIQFITENALRRAVKKFNARDGVAVVMDPATGDILAMASAPEFDPNRYSQYPIDNWRNRTVTDSFEPGSTFKVLVVAAALNSSKINAESVYNCENGAIKIGKDILRDTHSYGKLPVQDIIKYSSNIGALKIAFELGGEDLYATLKKFGIGSSTGIDFPGEINGTLRDYKTWQPVEQATVAFGQGLTTTPIQLAAAFTAAVNGGTYYRPKLATRIIERDGTVKLIPPEIISHPIRSDVSRTLRYMLKRVVEEGGTGTNAYSKSYSIGGKTGTAQKVGRNGRGYAEGKYFASFVGFAPVEEPRLVVFVGVDEPKGFYYGGTVAAPAVKEIIERSLGYMRVPAAASPAVVDMASRAKLPSKTKVEFEDSRRKVAFTEASKDSYIMPDLMGLTMREIITATNQVQLDTVTTGSGVASGQAPVAGAVVKRGQKVSINFRMPK